MSLVALPIVNTKTLVREHPHSNSTPRASRDRETLIISKFVGPPSNLSIEGRYIITKVELGSSEYPLHILSKMGSGVTIHVPLIPPRRPWMTANIDSNLARTPESVIVPGYLPEGLPVKPHSLSTKDFLNIPQPSLVSELSLAFVSGIHSSEPTFIYEIPSNKVKRQN